MLQRMQFMTTIGSHLLMHRCNMCIYCLLAIERTGAISAWKWLIPRRISN